jgi:outer membrane receptor for ferrienterochelin and colicin
LSKVNYKVYFGVKMKKLLLLLLIIQTSLFAGVTGKLVGKVIDKNTGEPLIGANVIIQGTTLGSVADREGRFIIINIPPGVYSVKVSFIGYESVLFENVKVIVDQTTQLSIDLSAKSLQVGEVVITAKSSMIHMDLTSSISVISREEIEALPVSNFTELLSLQAGVVGSGTDIHIRGGRSNETAYMIDGMLVQDPLLGGLATNIGKDAIQEMSLLSGTFNAEYGNALSGVVNVVTRDGSDDYSGKIEMKTSEFGVQEYKRLHQNIETASFSGPLISDKVKFFISGEQNDVGSYLPFGYDKELNFFSKISTTLIPDFKIMITNRGSKGSSQNYNHAYKYIPDQYLRVRRDSWQSVLTITHTLAANFYYDLRASYFNQGYYSGLDKDTSQYISSSDWTYLPDAGNGLEFYSRADPQEITDSRTASADIKLDALWQIGNLNEVKFGGTFKKNWLRYFYVYDPKRNYPYLNDYKTRPYEASSYIQDKIEFPELIINVGLRFDLMNANVQFRSDPLDPASIIKVSPRSQFSPRIGIAHPISDKTKLHFAYGHFFQNPEFRYLYENHQYDLNVREPIFGQANLDAERTIAYEVGISHQFSDRIAIDVTAYYKDITGLIGTQYFFPYVDGRYTGYTLYVNETYANVQGFEVNLTVRPDKYFSGGLTYTYSVAKGSASSEEENYPGTEASTQLYYLDFDQTHVFNAIGTFTIPIGEGPVIFGNTIFDNMDFNLIFKANSGFPYTPGGRDAGLVIKNSLREPSNYNLDLLFGKEFRIENNFRLRIFAEILNLTNHRNILYVYTDSGSPDYTQGTHSIEYMRDPSNYGPPRSIRLGASIKF